jgi:transposase, IS30 family
MPINLSEQRETGKPKPPRPHHDWERGTNENTNGLIRQYLPKGQSMTSLTQAQCDAIAHHLNEGPRKRHGYKTSNDCFPRP